MKKIYEEVKAEIIYLEKEDVIITSGEGNGQGGDAGGDGPEF